MEEEKCPKCGSKITMRYEQVAIGRTVSVSTGKVLKDHGFLETTCWNSICKCGWSGEIEAP